MLNVIKLWVIFAMVIGLQAGAFAHSKITTTQPSDGAVLQQAPAAIQLNFGDKIRLTKMTLQQSEQTVIDMDLSDHKDFKKKFSLPTNVQGKGLYTINWRGLSIDGHAVRGEFTFTVE